MMGASWPFEIADMNNELELGTIPAGQYAEAVWKRFKGHAMMWRQKIIQTGVYSDL